MPFWLFCSILFCFYIKFHCVAYVGLGITLTPWPYKHWDYRHVLTPGWCVCTLLQTLVDSMFFLL